MNVFTLLSYINKISIVAFFITALVVGYQIYILKKEKTKEQTPTIPDFKEKNNFNIVANFTSLPGSLTKKDLKALNYSKTIFLTISLLTVVIIVFVVSLIGKNNSSRNQALVNPPAVISQTPVSKSVSPTAKIILSPTLTAALPAELPSPTIEPTIDSSASSSVESNLDSSASPTVKKSSVTTTVSPTVVPTEIILALAPSSTPALSTTGGPSPTSGALTILPETGSIQKGLLIIGVAVSTIFFSFWF